MSDLARFQKRFAAALLDPALAPGFAAPGYDVYRNTAALGLLQALRDAYPTVRHIVGRAMFDTLALRFTRRHPPKTPVLAAYGEGFADFIGEGSVAARLPYLADVARLDRLRTECHLAADAPTLTPGELAAPRDWASLRLPLHPSARFAWLATPATTIWLAHLDAEMEELEPKWTAEGALFTRTDGGVRCRLIDRAEHRLLSGLRIGEPVGLAAAAVLALYPGTDITAVLVHLVEDGALSTIAEEK